MDLKDIRQIVELMNEHELSFFHLEQDGVNIKMKKGADFEALKEAMSAMPSAAPVAAAPVAVAAPVTGGVAAAAPAAAAAEGEPILSPMVGTYYGKPNPESPNFVEVGATVTEGQVLCIIEAMKVMNEIKAERSGTITQICVEDSTPVQFEDPLFFIK